MKNKIIKGDFFGIVKNIKTNSVDFIITDPPYNLGKGFMNDNQTLKNYKIFILKWLNECYRILKSNKKLMFTYSQVGMFWIKEIIDTTKFNFVQILIYQSSNISSFKSCPLYVRNYEPIFVLSKGKPEKLNRIDRKSVV